MTKEVSPFVFEKNEYGHVILTFAGLNLSGVAEIERLEIGGYFVGKDAKSCFLSTREDSYDLRHRLVPGQIYKVVLMPSSEIKRDADRTTTNLRKRGTEHYGYGKPLGGFIPRVREILSDKQMKEFGIQYAIALHNPIADPNDGPCVLMASRFDGGRGVRAIWSRPTDQWNTVGALVFQVLASS